MIPSTFWQARGWDIMRAFVKHLHNIVLLCSQLEGFFMRRLDCQQQNYSQHSRQSMLVFLPSRVKPLKVHWLCCKIGFFFCLQIDILFFILSLGEFKIESAAIKRAMAHIQSAY